MTLAEYLVKTNIFWSLSSCDHQNLLEEAIEQRDALAAQNMALRADLKSVDDALAALVARLRALADGL